MRREKPIEILTEEEVERIMAQASPRAPTGLRNKALIAVMYYAGLRCGESTALLLKDVDIARGEINVRRGKGAKQRLVILSEPGRSPLQLWIQARSALGLSSKSPLFCTISKGANALGSMQPGTELFETQVWKTLRRLAAAAGVEKRVHPHALRHSHAVRLARRGVAPNDIQGQLGHSSLATTSLYLDSVAPEDRARAIRTAG